MQLAIQALNSRIRNHGLSVKEILLQCDQITNEQVSINNANLSEEQDNTRIKNYIPKAASKAPRGKVASPTNLKIGDLAFIKDERSKNKARHRYIIKSTDAKYAKLQKLSSKFISRKHTVNLAKLYSASNMNITGHVFDNKDSDESDYDIEHVGSIQSEASEGKDGKTRQKK